MGAHLLVNHLPAVLKRMLGASAKLSRTIFSDRSPGFFHRKWGTITGDYETACREGGFKPWVGTNAKKGSRAQPPDIGDALLHETAISWLRRKEEKTRPQKPWEETPVELSQRLQRAVSHTNAEYNVRELCMEFPERLRMLATTTHGDWLPK